MSDPKLTTRKQYRAQQRAQIVLTIADEATRIDRVLDDVLRTRAQRIRDTLPKEQGVMTRSAADYRHHHTTPDRENVGAVLVEPRARARRGHGSWWRDPLFWWLGVVAWAVFALLLWWLLATQNVSASPESLSMIVGTLAGRSGQIAQIAHLAL